MGPASLKNKNILKLRPKLPAKADSLGTASSLFRLSQPKAFPGEPLPIFPYAMTVPIICIARSNELEGVPTVCRKRGEVPGRFPVRLRRRCC